MSDKNNRLMYAAALMIAVVLVLAVLLYYYAPDGPSGTTLHDIDYGAERNVTFGPEVGNVELEIDMDMGSLVIEFVEMEGVALVLNLTMEGEATTSDPGKVMQWSLLSDQLGENASIQFDQRINQSVLTSGLNIDCRIAIDPSFNLTLDVSDKVGDIEVGGWPELKLHGLAIRSDAGAIDVILKGGTVLGGDLSIEAKLGAVLVQWQDLALTDGWHDVDVSTSTGSVVIQVSQIRAFQGQVNWTTRTSLGNIDASISTVGSISSNITAEVGSGVLNSGTVVGYDVNRTQGRVAATSLNYPDDGNIEMDLQVDLGNMVLIANWVTL